jgi:hypothetical protein
MCPACGIVLVESPLRKAMCWGVYAAAISLIYFGRPWVVQVSLRAVIALLGALAAYTFLPGFVVKDERNG